MNCCGNKRNEWRNQTRNRTFPEKLENTVAASEHPNPIFEYTGNFSLQIAGTASGRIYHFNRKGDRLEVEYSDSFALMGERDLRVVRK